MRYSYLNSWQWISYMSTCFVLFLGQGWSHVKLSSAGDILWCWDSPQASVYSAIYVHQIHHRLLCRQPRLWSSLWLCHRGWENYQCFSLSTLISDKYFADHQIWCQFAKYYWFYLLAFIGFVFSQFLNWSFLKCIRFFLLLFFCLKNYIVCSSGWYFFPFWKTHTQKPHKNWLWVNTDTDRNVEIL